MNETIKKTLYHSHCFSLYFLYTISRFFLEFLRFDEIRGKVWYFSSSQWISLLLVFSSLLFYFLSKYSCSGKKKAKI
ncbi:MAG: hypothetical protein GX786_04305 [Clostridiales bacterium]|nr:hypothetical protein [Clostridiales bacterium]